MKIRINWKLVIVLALILVVIFWPRIKTVKIEQKIASNTPTVVVKKQNKYLVKKIVDGDTIVVLIDNKEESVRLIGIDAPEYKENNFLEAREKLKELIISKEIILENDETQSDKDKYGRLLRYVIVDNDILVNKKMIEEGWAKEYTYRVAYKYQNEFKLAEKTAKEKRVGIWMKK